MDGLQSKLLVLSTLLLWTGLIFVFSASYPLAARAYGQPAALLTRQSLGALLGLSAMVILWRIDYRHWARVDDILLLGIFAAAVATLFSGVAGGARWLRLGPFAFQPTEFGKLALILYLGGSLVRRGEAITEFRKGVAPYLCVLAAFGIVLVLQPDFGMLVLYAALVGFLLWAAGARLRHLCAAGALALPPLVGLMAVAPYRLARILAFLNPEGYQDTYAYQVYQSAMAIGAGGIVGRGLGASRAKLFYLPEAHNDFVFSVIAEETGLLGGCIVIGLLVGLVALGHRTAQRAPDRLGALYALGASFVLGLQALLNLAVVVGLLPVTGLTLPFLSYGGSSLAVSLGLVGLLLSVARQGASRKTTEATG